MNKGSGKILVVEDLVKYYGTGENLVRAVDHTDLEIERGKFTAIVGRSGSGKSTLLHLIGGLDRPDEGKVWIEGKDIFALKDERLAEFRRKKIGFVFQDFNLIPSLNVWENIVLPLGLDNRKVKKEDVEEVLEKIGLTDKMKTMPNALSGGQKQRTAIARALVTSEKFRQTMVMITHNEEIAQLADRIIRIEDGKIAGGRHVQSE